MKGIGMFIRKSVVVAALALPLGSMFAASAASAAPVQPTDDKVVDAPSDVTPMSCSHAWRNADPASGLLVSGTNARLREAPHLNSCEVFGLIQPSHSVDFHCYASGDTSGGISTWTHLRVLTGPNAGKQGWVHDSLLVGLGSKYRC